MNHIKEAMSRDFAEISHLRQKYFFDKAGVEDPYKWTFEHEDHKHFILSEDSNIVGYAHIQLWKDNRAAMRIIVIEEDKRNKWLGAKLLRFCEDYLRDNNYSIIHAESSSSAIAFCKKNGYTEMVFNDPDGYESDPNDIAVGRILIKHSKFNEK